MSTPYVPPKEAEIKVSKTVKSLTGSNATQAIPLFRFTGTIEVTGLWAEITTTLGTNITSASWRINDQGAQVAMTGNATLSNLPVGSQLSKVGVAATAMRSKSSAAAGINEVTANLPTLSLFLLNAKAGANSDVEFIYTTTETPTTGAIRFFLRWIALTEDANVVAL